MMKMTHTV